MTSSPRQNLVLSSILDRLLDNDPRSSAETAQAFFFDITRYRQAVARDLESLLNARCVVHGEDLKAEFPQVENSLFCFGIIDLSSLSLLNPDDRMMLKDCVKRAIERHEPRLAKVRVTLEPPKETPRMLHFRVDALLEAHPNRPPVVFDALLQLSSNTYQVKN